MKKLLAPTCLFLALTPVVGWAQSNVTVYGRADIGLDNSKTGANSSASQLRDNASRLGFRGVEDLGSGLRATYGIEAGINFDSGAVTTPMFRNSYVGLGGSFGNIALGRLDSANPTGSPLYSLITRNVSFVVHDAGATAIGTRVLNARNRTSNSIGYSSPELGGAIFMARYYLNGLDVLTTNTGPIRFDSDIKQLDLGVNYKVGGLGLGAGYAKDAVAGGLPTNTFNKKTTVVASYDFDQLKAYGLYGRDGYRNNATSRKDVNYWLVGASYDVGLNNITANYMERAVLTDKKGTLKKFQIGYAYRMSKRTQIYAIYDRDDPNSNAQNDVIRNVSFGIRHDF